MRAIYFGDPGDDVEEERDAIVKSLQMEGIGMEIEATDLPPWNERYDVLFFDWGGLSMGNSMLEHFCREILNESENNPGRVYVMTSQFTKRVMEEAKEDLNTAPDNVYLDIDSALNALRVYGEEVEPPVHDKLILPTRGSDKKEKECTMGGDGDCVHCDITECSGLNHAD